MPVSKYNISRNYQVIPHINVFLTSKAPGNLRAHPFSLNDINCDGLLIGFRETHAICTIMVDIYASQEPVHVQMMETW